MLDSEEKDILIRIDERVKGLTLWTEKHEAQHREQRSYLQKWLGIVFTSIVGIVVKIVFWK